MPQSYVRRPRGVDVVPAMRKKRLVLDVSTTSALHIKLQNPKLTFIGTNATLLQANVPTGSTMGPQNEYGCLIDRSTNECITCCNEEPTVVGQSYNTKMKTAEYYRMIWEFGHGRQFAICLGPPIQ
jgi:hypothetical protein